MTLERLTMAEHLPADFVPERDVISQSALARVPVRAYLLIGDVAATIVGTIAGFSAGAFAAPGEWQAGTVAFAALLVSTSCLRLYRSRLSPSMLDDLPYLATALVVATLTGLAYDDVGGGVRSRPEFLAVMGFVGAMVLCGRALLYSIVRWARRTGRVQYPCVVIGAGQVGRQLARTLRSHRDFGLNVVGFVDENPPRPVDGHSLPAPLLGGYASLAAQIAAHQVRVAIVAFGGMREQQLVSLLRACDRAQCETFFVPRLYEAQSTTRDMEQIWGIPLVRVRRAPYLRFSWRLKRAADIAIAGAALILCAPVLLACALAVRLETGPNVLFRQIRVGVDNRSFELLKFRSLRPATEQEAATTWSVAEDDRMGPVGRVLRRTSLDELPQLWNVIRGDMSLVGPRPERPFFVEQFEREIPGYSDRHRVHAGLTGWAQIHGLRGDTSIEDRAIFDNYYIENWSLWGDAKILMRTVHQVFRHGDY